MSRIKPEMSSGLVMPSLFRLLFILALLAGMAYGSMYALTVFVEPNPREMTVRIPAKKLDPR